MPYIKYFADSYPSYDPLQQVKQQAVEAGPTSIAAYWYISNLAVAEIQENQVRTYCCSGRQQPVCSNILKYFFGPVYLWIFSSFLLVCPSVCPKLNSVCQTPPHFDLSLHQPASLYLGKCRGGLIRDEKEEGRGGGVLSTFCLKSAQKLWIDPH